MTYPLVYIEVTVHAASKIPRAGLEPATSRLKGDATHQTAAICKSRIIWQVTFWRSPNWATVADRPDWIRTNNTKLPIEVSATSALISQESSSQFFMLLPYHLATGRNVGLLFHPTKSRKWRQKARASRNADCRICTHGSFTFSGFQDRCFRLLSQVGMCGVSVPPH